MIPRSPSEESFTVLEPSPVSQKPSKGKAFWLSFVAIVVSTTLSALDLTAVGTALPTITQDLNGGDKFVWIGSAYALASTAVLPLLGALADTFGRRPVMLCSIALFSIGSALAGAAQNINMLIAARSISFVMILLKSPLTSGIQLFKVLEEAEFFLCPKSSFPILSLSLSVVFTKACSVSRGVLLLELALRLYVPPFSSVQLLTLVFQGGVLAEKASWRWIFCLCPFHFHSACKYLSLSRP
jgi:MFS family permease